MSVQAWNKVTHHARAQVMHYITLQVHQIMLLDAVQGTAISLQRELPCDFRGRVCRLDPFGMLHRRRGARSYSQIVELTVTFCFNSLSPSSPLPTGFDTLVVSTRSVRLTSGGSSNSSVGGADPTPE
jgi:hypothetical protein